MILKEPVLERCVLVALTSNSKTDVLAVRFSSSISLSLSRVCPLLVRAAVSVEFRTWDSERSLRFLAGQSSGGIGTRVSCLSSGTVFDCPFGVCVFVCAVPA